MTQPFETAPEPMPFVPIQGFFGQICQSFDAGTKIATAMGDVPVGELWQGDHVLTYDGGTVPVLWTGQGALHGRDMATPVLFTPGAIGNYAPLRLAPEQLVLFASAQAELLFGSHEVLVPARAMVNGRDICFALGKEQHYVQLLLAHHALVFAEGASCASFLPDGPHSTQQAVRPVLSYAEALALMGG